jgi:hypothetical protein
MIGGSRLLAAGLLALVLALPAVPGEAQAGPALPLRPDALIRRYSEATVVGDDIYNETASGQTQVAQVISEGRVRFVVRFENDGTTEDDLVVAGTRNQTHFGIRYFVGTQEVSARVRNRSYRFLDVAPGAHRAMTVEVTAKRSAPVGRRVVVGVAVRSDADDLLVDRVRAIVYRSQGRETAIRGGTLTTVATAERWAEAQGASARFVRNAAIYFELAASRGIRPEVAYAQSAKETAYGQFGGVIDATFNNPCGLKTAAGGDDSDPNAHMRFTSWRQGIKACLDHLALYAGAPGYPRASTPDPRHFASIRGRSPTVERLGANWAPAPDYGRSIVYDYLNPLLAS